jgi:hypothetical protein
LNPRDEVPSDLDGDWIIQALVPDPLLRDGFKTDLRFYLLIHSNNIGRSRRAGPIFIRSAPFPYEHGRIESEITNTAYSRRLGKPPQIAPLDAVNEFSPTIRELLRLKVDGLASAIISARFSHAQQARRNIAHRILLWGVDAIASECGDDDIRLQLLEINVHPQLFRGSDVCDALVSEMLGTEFLPEFLMGHA